MRQKVLIIILLLTLLGIYLRLDGTLKGYFAFTYDQGRDFVDLSNIVQSKDIRLIGPPTGIEGVFHGVWWHWLLIPIFLMLKGNPVYVVSTFNIISALTIPLAFVLGKHLKSDTLGIVLASLVTVSHFFIGTASQLWHPNIVPLLMLLLLIVTVKYIKKTASFFWIGFVLGSIFEFEFGIGGLFLPAYVLGCLLAGIRPNKKELVIGICGFGLWLVPRILFEMRHNFLQTKSLISYINSSPQLSGSDPFLLRLSNRFKQFFAIFNDSFAGNDFVVWLLILLIVGFVVLLYKTRERKLEKTTVNILLLTIVGLLLMSALYPSALWNYYLISLPVLFLPLVGLALIFLISRYRFIGWGVLLFLLILNFSPWNHFGRPVWEGDASVYKNQIKIVDEVYAHAEGKPFNIQVYSPSVIDYNYQYLFSWYGTKNYGYNADRENVQNQVFLIIEPDPWNKGLKEIWLKERIGDGETVWQSIFPGGIEVEHRKRKSS